MVREQRSARGGRFLLAYGILGAILGATAVGYASLAFQPEAKRSSIWSSWRPTADGNPGAQQIAAYVARRYRLESGRPIVAVLAGVPSVQAGQEVPVSAFAVEPPTTGLDAAEGYKVYPANSSVRFILCGLGKSCAIKEGTPSQDRHRLLRREALELALYSFRYLDGVDSVIAFLPPPKNQQANSALYFRRDELADMLDRPLQDTLPSPVPSLGSIDSFERSRIDRLTTPKLFKFAYQQGPDGAAVIVLTPQALTG